MQRNNQNGWYTDIQVLALLNAVQTYCKQGNNLNDVTGEMFSDKSAHMLNCFLSSKSHKETIGKFKGPLLTDEGCVDYDPIGSNIIEE